MKNAELKRLSLLDELEISSTRRDGPVYTIQKNKMMGESSLKKT